MLLQVHPYVVPLLISAIVNLAMGILVWQRRSASGAYQLLLINAAAAVWAAAYALVWASPNRNPQIFWLSAAYIGALFIPTGFLIFALYYTGHQAWLTSRRLALLCIEPLFTLAVIWTNPLHWYFFDVLRMYQHSSFMVLYWEGGPWFWANFAYSYFLALIALVLLVRFFFRSKGAYRSQAAIVIFGSLVPVAANMFSISGLSPLAYLDLTPLGFSAMGLVLAYALFQFRLFDLVPIARSFVIEKISDSVIVMDARGRLVDINPAGRALTGFDESSLGAAWQEVFFKWPGVMDQYRNAREAHAETKTQDDPARYMEIQIDPLHDNRNRFVGRVIVLRDITSRKHSEEQLRHAHGSLQKQFAEIQELETKFREQAIRDPLTGLFNRRYMEEVLTLELSKAGQTGDPVSAMILDLDHFKIINDTYGHAAGDLVLTALAAQLSEETRKSDIICRYGGEEFVVVMPGASIKQALQRVEKWRLRFQETPIHYQNVIIHCTFSAGLVCYPQDATTVKGIFNAADEAMYAAKQSGRNRVVSAKSQVQ